MIANRSPATTAGGGAIPFFWGKTSRHGRTAEHDEESETTSMNVSVRRGLLSRYHIVLLCALLVFASFMTYTVGRCLSISELIFKNNRTARTVQFFGRPNRVLK